MRPGGVSFLFDSKTFSHDEATTSTSENSDFLSRCRVDLMTRLEADNWSSIYSRKIAGKAKKKTFLRGIKFRRGNVSLSDSASDS